MPKLLRPAAPRFIRSHPLAVGLSDAVLFNGASGWNHANEAAQPTFFGTMAAEPTADSPGSRASSGTNYATVLPTYNIAAGAHTVSFLWKPVSNSAQFVNTLEKTNGTSVEWAVFTNYSFNVGNLSYFFVGGGASGDINIPVGMLDGGTYRLTITRDTANLVTFYVNGRSAGSITLSGSTGQAGSSWQIGKATSGNTNPNAVYGDLFVWPARLLSADEVMQHAAEPWAMLRPARRLLKVSSVPVTATPGAGNLTIQGRAPTVAAGVAAAVGAGALALQGAAPAVAAGVALAIGAGTLSLAGAAPSVTAGAVLSLGAGALALAGAAPTVLAGAALSPGAGALAFQGFAPSIAAGAALSPGVATITIQGHAVDLGEPLAPAPAWATLTWPLGDRAVVWAAESRDIAWGAVNRTITWRGYEMPDRVFVIPPAHVEDELPYSFTFEGFGTGDDVASYTVTVPSGVTLLDDSSSGQIVTTQLGATAAGTHRIIVRAISDAGSKATLEANWTVSDPD